MSIVKLDKTIDENKEVLQKEVKCIKDLLKYWTYYLGETVNSFTTNEAKINAKILLLQIEEFGVMNYPNWIEEVFIKEENKILLEEILVDSVGVVVDEMPINAMVMVFLDHLVDRPITEEEWYEFSKLRIVIDQEKEKDNRKENVMEDIKKVFQEFDKETEDVDVELTKDTTEEQEETVMEKEEKAEDTEVKENKISTWKKVAIGATVVAAVAGAAWFLTNKNK